MSTLPRLVDIPKIQGRNKGERNPRPAPERVFLESVVETMARVHSTRGRSIFALTAASRRAGTSHVVNLLAEELVLQYEATVAIVPSEALKGGDPKRLPQGFIEHAPNIWTAVADQALEQMPDFALESVWVSPGAKNFDFILIDCPALDQNAQTLRWIDLADGVFLVVEAGVTRIAQIASAVRSLNSAPPRRLAGLILNRRTYPIPGFLYRLL
jgi:Mrp family chromosome partitioning ATPase